MHNLYTFCEPERLQVFNMLQSILQFYLLSSPSVLGHLTIVFSFLLQCPLTNFHSVFGNFVIFSYIIFDLHDSATLETSLIHVPN